MTTETVVVGRTEAADDADRFDVLDRVIEDAGFWDRLEERRSAVGKEPDELLVAVKPNLMMFYSRDDMSVITEPALVEHLIDRLVERGYTNVALVESQNVYGNWFENRDVETVAAHAGYDPGNYRIVDLTRDTVAHEYAGDLGLYLVGKTWRDADFRVSFAKNKTHFSTKFTLTIKNIYGTTPEQNKFREYHRDREFDRVTVEMLKEFPVHFGIVDATVSADGVMGLKADLSPKRTETIIAGRDIVAVDHVGAEKMGLNPLRSRFHRLAVEELGLPEIDRVGDTAPYEDWDNVPEYLDDFFNFGEEWYGYFNFMGFVSADMDPAFPPKIRSKLVLGIRDVFLWILKAVSRYE